ncbi:hypothetical protein ACW9KT_10830 [Hymenobacter sp. HD11105]
MKTTEHIHPNMIAEFAHSPEFALKMKAFNYLDCRHLGMSATESQALYSVSEGFANRYEAEWTRVRGHVYH